MKLGEQGTLKTMHDRMINDIGSMDCPEQNFNEVGLEKVLSNNAFLITIFNFINFLDCWSLLCSGHGYCYCNIYICLWIHQEKEEYKGLVNSTTLHWGSTVGRRFEASPKETQFRKFEFKIGCNSHSGM